MVQVLQQHYASNTKADTTGGIDTCWKSHQQPAIASSTSPHRRSASSSRSAPSWCWRSATQGYWLVRTQVKPGPWFANT